MSQGDFVLSVFKRHLEAAGYPTEDVKYSLSSCQGDGMAFYGPISYEGSIILANRLLKKMWRRWAISALEKLNEVGEKPFNIRCNSNHYCHSNTMDVEFDRDYLTDSGDFSDRHVYALDILFSKIEEDVIAVSSFLEREGYSIIEASPYEKESIRTFETQSFRVEINALPEDYGYSVMVSDIEDVFMFSADRAGICTLHVAVIDKENEDVLAEERLSGVVFDKDTKNLHKRFDGQIRYLLTEVISEARSTLN